jgi:inner membrane protein
MDTVTQIALGATIGEAGFRRRLGGRAVVMGGFCGLAPDLDMVAGLAGPWASLVHHRGASHSVVVLPVVALALALAGRRWTKRGSLGTWWHLCAWSLVTHPLLDACTSYGTQLLAPFSRTRFAIDAVSILDPFYSLPLLVAVVLAVRRRVERRRSQRFAAWALGLTTLYLAAGWLLSGRAEATARAELEAAAFDPVELRATPTFFNNVAFRIVAKDEAGNLAVGYRSVVAPRPASYVRLSRADGPMVRAALESERGRLFRWFAMGLVHARREGRVVWLSDQRYGSITAPTESVFRAKAMFDRRDALQTVVRVEERPETDVGRELRALWRLITRGEVTASDVDLPMRDASLRRSGNPVTVRVPCRPRPPAPSSRPSSSP